ncbi:MAG: aminotransferase class III-fold pyridoxal phosphate-dependent enzyme, partial [Hyphomicrobiaceae bacterium]
MPDDTVSSAGYAESESEGIAIIAMAGRFPNARTHHDLWKLVRGKTNAVSRFAMRDIEDSFRQETRASPEYVPFRPVLEDADMFDADFFRMYPKEAALTDPQFRVFLEVCWEAMERAGYHPARMPELTGVFGGCSMSTYFLHHVLQDRETLEEFTSNYQVGCYPMLMGALNDTLATRVSYKLGLRGPAMTVQSACSTSLLAIAQACQSLSLYQCDMALAGGVSITFPQKRGYLALDGGMVTSDGVCRPFDAGANGTIFGSGAGVAILKRLSEALEDKDEIIAVIRGYAVTNDGSDKVGFAAPSVSGQAAAIGLAHEMAGVGPGNIGYVECHGTGTPLGDPIEMEGLKRAFGPDWPRNSCALGTVKANIGHLDAAAGVTGLIQAALALQHGEIPPLANYQKPNPALEIDESPFFVPREPMPWPQSSRRRMAGVSAFGVGGTNVHVVLEEAPPQADDIAAAPIDTPQLLPVSARTDAALAAALAQLADHIEQTPGQPLSDIANTLQIGRQPFEVRAAVAAETHRDAVEGLRKKAKRTGNGRRSAEASKVAFMFPGQGAQYPGMGRRLYETEHDFRAIVDRGAESLEPLVGQNIARLLYETPPPEDGEPHPIRLTVLAQPALFLVEYAMAGLLRKCGVSPAVMIGHSVGEFVAACLAGVFTFEDGLKLVAARGRLMQDQPGGAMLAVRAGEGDVRCLLDDGVEIAAINAPNLCVVAGSFEGIADFEHRLDSAGIAGRQLHTSHAFHSAMMTPVCGPLAKVCASIRLEEPKLRYVSCVSGDWIKPEEATDPQYWARHCRAAVRFSDGLEVLRRERGLVLLEVGPGRTLATFAAQSAPVAKVGERRERPTITTLPEASAERDDHVHFLEAIGELWCEHVDVDWQHVKTPSSRRVELPTYPFERKRHWIEPPTVVRKPAPGAMQQLAAEPGPILVQGKATDAPLVPAGAPPHVATETGIMSDRQHVIQGEIFGILQALSGIELDAGQPDVTFIEMGFDSLFLGQLATEIKKKWQVKIAFRQLLRELPSPAALAGRLVESVPDGTAIAAADSTPEPVTSSVPVEVLRNGSATRHQVPVPGPDATNPATQMFAARSDGGALEGILREQLAVMQNVVTQQLSLLQATPLSGAPNLPSQAVAQMPRLPKPGQVAVQPPAVAGGKITAQHAAEKLPTTNGSEPKSRFDAYKGARKVGNANTDITPEQQQFIDRLVADYTRRTPTSKTLTQKYRRVLADPRTANGFRSEWKEMVYPLVVDRSDGSKVWDVDGNVYVDLVNGYGPIAFGHSPDFVQDALAVQLASGFATGPQSPLAGEVAQLFAEMTGNERVTFCNTGSEAVMAAIRLARTVTGRNKVVAFSGSYHGQFDEVIIHGRRADAEPGAIAAAIGVPPESIANMIVLPYGAPESLDYIRDHADDLAAVLVEVVQSRHPDYLPEAFIRELREITRQSETALVFDEVVTGFRAHPAGMQGYLGIRADLATYGKVVGGGMPIGVLAGRAEFMDALDGGHWQYGDESVPEVAPTFFAGTFVRHPLVLAAVKSVLEHIKAEGVGLLEGLSGRTAGLVRDINRACAERGIEIEIGWFSSFFYIDLASGGPLASLFYPLMRMKGVHIQEGFPCYMTTAHDDDDLALIVDAVEASLDELQAAGILASGNERTPRHTGDAVAASGGDEPREQLAPLTEPQREVWLAAQLSDAASCAFNESVSVRFSGNLDAGCLEHALAEVFNRHEALRASFGQTAERMRVAAKLECPMRNVDAAAESDPDGVLSAVIADDAATPFDLSAGPPVRATLVRLSPGASVLVLTAHHIACDGWSMNVLLDEVAQCYNARHEGGHSALPSPTSFVRFARECAAHRRDHAANEAYWLGQYKEIPALPELPADRPRPERRTYRGGTYTTRIGQDLTDRVRSTSAGQKATLFATLFSVFQVLAGRLANSEDVVVAVPTAGQSLVEGGDTLVGHCVNFLPLRTPFSFEAPFSAHLKSVSDYLLDAFEHQDYTLGTLVRKLALRRDLT